MKFIRRKWKQFRVWETHHANLAEESRRNPQIRETPWANDARNPNSYSDSHLL